MQGSGYNRVAIQKNSTFLEQLAEKSPQIAQLSKTPTPISKMRSYVENMFPGEEEKFTQGGTYVLRRIGLNLFFFV